MDKIAIKNYAIWARNELIDKVSQKAEEFKINETDSTDTNLKTINDVPLNTEQINQRKSLIEKIKKSSYQEVIEEVAYTWFNRFIALRFMEVNGYLPSMVKVFTDEENNFKPEILSQAIHIELKGLDKNKVIKLKEDNKDDELFKYLITVQCNDLNTILPGMFKKIDDYTVLLFPDNQLREGSVIERLVRDIPEEDWKDQVQIIGWLYQYYNTEPKDKVINIYKGNVEKKDIPAATQIFTTDWVVRYIVDNSLGRYWLERNPNSSLQEKLKYFIPSKSGEINYVNEIIKPEEIKIFDPSVGSGHFPAYAFDVLMDIYREYGYTDNDAVVSILENNLYGIDIDTRAYQLAYFSIMMKARQYNRRIFSKKIQPNILVFHESDNIDREELSNLKSKLNKNYQDKAKKQLNLLLDDFKDAKNIGSIINIGEYDLDSIEDFLDNSEVTLLSSNYSDIEIIKKIIEIARLFKAKYHVVITNPPYLNKYNPKLKKYVVDNYKDYKQDLFSVFMYKGFEFALEGGYCGYMTPFVWMFISSYEKLRKYILDNKSISSLIQMEYSAFEEATVPICSFVFKNDSNELGYYIKLSDYKGGMDVQKERTLYAIQNPDCGYYYETNKNNFSKIPGSPIAYWASEKMYKVFQENNKLSLYYDAKFGLSSANNELYFRKWFEINVLMFSFPNNKFILDKKLKWFPINNGGKYCKWYGNNEDVIYWLNDGYEIKNNGKSTIRNKDYYYEQGITWTPISSSGTSFRAFNEGYIFTSAGFCMFKRGEISKNYMLGFLNTTVTEEILKIISPTINYNVGHINDLPIIFSETNKKKVDFLVEENISLSKNDWDMHETSWDFEKSPLLSNKVDGRVETAYETYKAEVNERFAKLKENEEELNTIFIDIYGLQDELTAEVEDKDITVRKADLERDIKSFISYAIGCMMGRYSLNEEGLIYAGGEFDESRYHSFIPDRDSIVPILYEDYFDDDAVSRFIEFINSVYSPETLEENLTFIANALEGKGSSREVIRNYLIKDFYRDHLKMYQKRPIYWLFDAGKKNSFKALVYMHRYEKDTMAKLRTDYIHPLQDRYRLMIEDIESKIDSVDTSQKVKLNKELKDLKDKAEELRVYEEKIHHLADQMIEIDLDDGVEYNYELFSDVLAKRR